MAQKYIGIDLGSHEVKVVVATAGLRGVNVLNAYQERVEIGEGEDALGASVRTAIGLLRERGLTHLPTGIALPGSVGSYRVLKFPFPDQKRIVQAIQFEIEGQFAVPTSELDYDHIVGPATGGGGRALVVAVRRKILDQTVQAFRDAGTEIRLLTVSPLALAQLVIGKIAPLPPDADENMRPAALLVDVGERSTELVAISDKVPLAVRTLRRGGRHVTRALQKAYGFDVAGAEVAKERDAFLPHAALGELSAEQRASAEKTAHALEAVVREIEHTRLWLRTEYEHELTEIRLTGGTAELRGFQPYLQEQLGLPVHFAAPGDGVGIRGTADLRWTRTSAAAGAALGAAKRPNIQLYDMTSVTADGSWIQEKFMTLASLGIAVVAFAAIDTIVKVKAMETQRDRYVSELESASLTVFGEELSTLADVEERLAAVEGADLTAQLPDRGAFEVLEMVTRAAAPSDADQAAAQAAAGVTLGGGPTAVDPNGVVTGTNPDGSPAMFDATGNPLTGPTAAPGAGPPAEDGEEEEGADPGAGPVDPSAGIVVSDQLIVQRIDIRELKLEMKVEATRATAQDRLALKLEELGCITDIKKGKVRDSKDKKVFELEMSHNCFRQMPGGGEDS
jgi:type IV pilus assembly protein PilM